MNSNAENKSGYPPNHDTVAMNSYHQPPGEGGTPHPVYPPPSSPYLSMNNKHPSPPPAFGNAAYPGAAAPPVFHQPSQVVQPGVIPPLMAGTHQPIQPTHFPYPPQSFADVPATVSMPTPTYTTPIISSHPVASIASYPPGAIGQPPVDLSHIPYPIAAPYPPQPLPMHQNNAQIGFIPQPVDVSLPCNPVLMQFIVPSTPGPQHSQAPTQRIELGNPTVKPAPQFNVQSDAEELRDTLKQPSPNKDVLINILCHRSLEQRLEIAKKFQEITELNLVTELTTKFDCNFQKILIALLTPLIDFYVQELNESLENYDHDSTIDILCPLSNYEMYTLKYIYQKKYGIPLETEIQSKTSEHLKRLLLSLCECRRDESGITNLASAQYDARQLASQENPYDDERVCFYKEIFSKRNFGQIKMISEEYQKITGQALEKTIKSKFIMDDKQGYLCIVRYSQDKYGFYAKRLHRSMAGMGTNDNQLIRLVVTRCEIDLQDIKETFGQMFGKSLRSWIKGDTSGHYKYCLYELIGEKRSNK